MRALLLVLAGCWTGSSATPTTPEQPTPTRPEPAGGLECAGVVAHAMEISKEELAKTAKPDQIERVRIAAIDTCLELRWSQELLGCFNGARTSDDLGTCQSKMTKAQNDDMQKRLVEAIQDSPAANPCGNPCSP